MSLTRGLVTLVLQPVGILCACAVVLFARWPRRIESRLVAVAAVGALVIGVVAWVGGGHASARAAREHCVGEYAGQSRLPFLHWVKARMGTRAVYRLLYAPPPDALCVYFALLPALPAVPGEHANWTIDLGAIPAATLTRLARNDPSVRIFSPGLALAEDQRAQ